MLLPEPSEPIKTLTLVVGGGLCNRLKPIFSGSYLAALSGRRLRVHWLKDLDVQPDEPDQHVHYEWPGTWSDLFSTPLDMVGWGPAEETMKRSPEWKLPNAWDYPIIELDDPRIDVVRTTWRFLRQAGDQPLDCLLEPHPSLVPQGCNLIRSLRECRPAAALQDKVDRFAATHDIGSSSLGVHVRSQHSWCKRFGWQAYRDLIERNLQEVSPNVIFLSSDSKEYEEKLLAAYPQMVAFPKDSHDCVPSLASGDAVVDLFLLAKAGTLMGTTASTFVHTAWYLAGCESRFIPLW